MNTIQAVYRDGVFRPTEPVDLLEHTVVEFELKIAPRLPKAEDISGDMTEGLRKIYAVLGERYASGHIDTAARHNEHQP